MKTEIKISLVSILFVFAIALVIYSEGGNLTGQAIADIDLEGINNPSESIQKQQIQEKATKQEALDKINNSQKIILAIKEEGITTNRLNDSLLEAKRIFEQAEYAEILRNNSLNYEQQREAREALRLVNWKDITYQDVLAHTQEIENISKEAIKVRDLLNLKEKKVYSEESQELFNKAKEAFNNERYEEAERLVLEFEQIIEEKQAQESGLSGLQKGARNTFQRYWAYLLLGIIIIGVLSYTTYKKIRKRILKKKIKKMKMEKVSLLHLMKQTQIERYRENKISGIVYNIRIKKYKERFNFLKQQIPVLEKELHQRKEDKESTKSLKKKK